MDSRLRIVLIAALGAVLLYFTVLRKPDSAPPSLREPAAVPATDTRGGPPESFEIRSGPLVAQVSTYSGAISEWRLDTAQFRSTERGDGISTTDREPFYPLRTNLVFERDGHEVSLPTYLTFRPTQHSGNELVLTATPPGSDLEIQRVYRPHTQYAFRVLTRVINHGGAGRVRLSQGLYHWVLKSQEDGHMFTPSWQRSEGMCERRGRGTMFRKPGGELLGRSPDGDGVFSAADFVGLGNTYFVSALVPVDDMAACHLRAESRGADSTAGTLYYAQLSWPAARINTGESHDFRVIAYFGPKSGPTLTAAAPALRDSADLGTFAIIARALLRLLQLLHSVVKNWGLAIILLTVIVRTALYPLLARSIKSMAVMQKIKPELDELNARFADNSEQRGLATMELYRKHGVNPLAGCLPQFAQLPIWWALYTTLQTSVELYHAPFFGWVTDLSARDPYFILPLVLGVVMFAQQKLMPPAMPDPTQAKMMLYFMPIFLTAISLFLPAGLALYMLVNSGLAILQQRFTKAQVDRMVSAANGGIEVRPAGETLLESRNSKGSRRG